MPKVSVTYHAPKGDNKVVEMHGATLYDGKAEDIEVDDDTLARLKANQCFSVSDAKPQPGGTHQPPDHDPHEKPDPHEKHKGR